MRQLSHDIFPIHSTLNHKDHHMVEKIWNLIFDFIRIGILGSYDYFCGLFSQLLAWNLVDTVEPAVIPILLGGGVQFLSPRGVRQYLALVGHRAYPSGMLLLEYEVIQTAEGTNEVAGGKE